MSAQITQVIDEVEQREGGLLSFSIVLALWKQVLLSIVYTVALAAILIVALALMILGPQVMD